MRTTLEPGPRTPAEAEHAPVGRRCSAAPGRRSARTGRTRANARSSVRGGATSFSCRRIVDCCTSRRSFVWPGSCSSAAPATQTQARPDRARPATRPPIESSIRSGGSTDRPPRANEPAIDATACSTSAPTSAPTSAASGVYGELDAVVQDVRREPRADHRAGREAAERERRRDEPALEPGERRDRDHGQGDPVDAVHRSRVRRAPALPCRRYTPAPNRGRSSVG